jgi:hypothetical protein
VDHSKKILLVFIIEKASHEKKILLYDFENGCPHSYSYSISFIDIFIRNAIVLCKKLFEVLKTYRNEIDRVEYGAKMTWNFHKL